MMAPSRAFAIVVCLFILVCGQTAYGEVEIDVYGVGALKEGNLAKAEQSALKDAFSKAFLQAALQYVPSSSSRELVSQLPSYMAVRGSKDILQYQITSRDRQYDALLVAIRIKIDEEPLKDWLYAHTLAMPQEMRPKILLMVSSYGPSIDESYKWWFKRGKKSYSPIEQQLSDELKGRGEFVMKPPKRIRGISFKDIKPEGLAEAAGADILITGSVTYTPLADTLYECIIDLSMIDIQTMSPITGWSTSRRGDFGHQEMHSILIGSIIDTLCARIDHKILSLSPLSMKNRLCIEEIKDYLTYQNIINSLGSMQSISSILMTSIQGHTICHDITIKGSLYDAMDNLKREQIADMDIVIDDDTAFIKIIGK